MTKERIIYSVRIEGIGKASAVAASGDDYQYRWATSTAPSDVDADGLYQDAWRDVGGGARPRFSLSPIRQTHDYRTGRGSIEGIKVPLHAAGGAEGVLAGALLDTASVVKATISSALTTGATSVVVDLAQGVFSGDLEDVEVGLGRERLVLGTASGSGPHTYTGCKRGVHGTPAVSADPDAFGQDVEIVTKQHALRGRRVVLSELNPDTASDLDDEVDVWVGVLEDIDEVNINALALDTRGLLSLLDVPLYGNPWTGRITASWDDGGRPGANIQTAEVPGRLAPANPATLGSSPAVGDTFLVRVKGSLYEARAIQALRLFYSIDLDQPLFGTRAIRPDDLKSGDLVTEVLQMGPAAVGGGTPGDAALPLGGVDGDFATALLQLLTGTLRGDNGAWDTGVDFGVRFPVAMIDTDSFRTVKVAFGPDLEWPRLFVGDKDPDDADKALDWIEKKLRPFGICLTVSLDGRLALEYLRDLPRANESLITVTDSDTLEGTRIQGKKGLSKSLDTLHVTYGGAASFKGNNLGAGELIARQRQLGPGTDERLDFQPLADRATCARFAKAYFDRYADGPRSVEFEVPLSKKVVVGGLHLLTSAQVYGRDGALDLKEGVSQDKAVVVERTIDLEGHAITYVSELHGQGVQFAWHAPWAQVVSAATRTLTVVANVAQPTSGGVYDDDPAQFEAGDVCRVTDDTGASKATGLVVESVSSSPAQWCSPARRMWPQEPLVRRGGLYRVRQLRRCTTRQKQAATPSTRTAQGGSARRRITRRGTARWPTRSSTRTLRTLIAHRGESTTSSPTTWRRCRRGARARGSSSSRPPTL